MAKLTLQVIGDFSDVEKKIQAVETKLTQKPLQIKVDASGIDAVTKDLIQYAKWSAKATAAEADLQKQKSKTAAATARQAEALSKYNIQVERTNTEVQRTATEQARLKTQTERTNTEIERQVTQEKRLETQQERTNTEIERNKRALDDAGKAAENTGAQFNLLSGILQRLQSAAISAVVKSLRDAISTLKDVDDQLVTVRKVTGFSSEQIQQIKEQAFEVASAYGQTADAYLESVAAFSRAGYKEQASDLAELATKTQIVGDTTSEVANQFLISVDAAYKYGGSIKELSKVLDGANEIDNKYATSIEKIASGMGIVAPVAAQMHVSVDELAASIGTITAVTQRSGTEAARALRALFLNIAGDTKTEIDEGVTWTTGEIEGLRDVIKMYAKDAYDAAQATGSIIDPMRAMEGLAKSMQEGVLTEQRLIEMVSDIGGKLRTSQLLAIIQNWDMYQSMLQDYAGAIGSADREVENALDSWTRKTNILKNTTAELVNRIVDTNTVKGAIGFITGIVKTIDNAIIVFQKLTGFVDTATVSYAEHNRILEERQKQYDELNSSTGELQTLKSNVDNLTEAELQRLGVLEAQTAELDKQIKKEKEQAFYAWRVEQTGIRYEASKTGTMDVQYYSKLESEVSKAQFAFAKLDAMYRNGTTAQDAYIQGVKNLINAISQNAEAVQKGKDAGVELTDAETRLLSLYETLTYILGKHTAETQANTTAQQYNAAATEQAANSQSLFAKAFEEANSKSSLTYGTIKQIDAILPGFSAKILDASGNLTAEGKAALSSKSALVDLIGTMISANATGMSFEGQIAALMDLAAAAGIASDAVAGIFSGVGGPSFGDDGQIDVGAEKAYARSKANPTRTINKLLDDMKSTLKNSEYARTDGIGGGGGSTEDKRLTTLKEIVSFRKAELSFLEASGASVADQVAKMREIQAALHDQAEYLRQTEGETANVLALSTEWWNIQEKISKLLEEDTVEPLKEIVELRKEELSYLKASGASEEEQIAKMRQIQDSLKAQEAEMRRTGADEKEILAVATEWYNIENEIVDLQDKIAQQLRDEIAQTLTDIVDSLKDAENSMLSPLQAQLDALNAAHDAVQDRREEEEKILAVEKARIALENAQRERTVRQYNAKTGSWEWVANAKNVESAQKALADANADLSKYYAEKEYDAAKTALEAQITNTKSAFSALRDAMNEAAQAIKDGKMSYEEAYAYIQNAMHDIYDDYGVDLTGVLNTSVKEFGKVNTAIKGLLSTLGKDTQAAANQAMANLDGTEDDINTGIGLFTLYMQNALKTNDPEKAIKELCDAINQGVVTDLHSVSDILKALNGDYAGISASTAKLWALTKMQANSIAWHMTSDANTQAALHAENMQLGTAIGLSYNSSTGTWHDQSGQQVYTLNAVNGAWTSALNGNAAGGTSTGTAGSGAAGGTQSEESAFYNNPNTSAYYKTPKQVDVETDASGNVIAYSVVASDGERVRVSKDDDLRAFEFVDSAAKGSPVAESLGGASRKYLYSILRKDDGTYAVIGHDRATGEQEFRFFDRGGILHGTGGIKATASDEMVLPPGMTSRLLNAEMTGAFDALLRHLGIVTAAAESIAGFGGGITRNSIGEQHNGDVFYIDGIELKNITGSTTLNDLARCAKNLALQRGS